MAKRLQVLDLSTSKIPLKSKGEARDILNWENEFWLQNGNKMRVFGTVEEVFSPGASKSGDSSKDL